MIPSKLDELVDTYNIDTATEHFKRLEFLEKLAARKDLRGAAILELGSANGQLTELLAKLSPRVVAVDGSARFLAMAKARPANHKVRFVHCAFEELALTEQFDVVVMHHILEHVEDPRRILSGVRTLLSSQGVIAVSVPNAHALSRQLALKMKLMGSLYDLTDNDRRHGHYRVYDDKSLEEELTSAGFGIIARHGLSFKLFADFQNEQIVKAGVIGEAQFRGLWKLADDYRTVSGALMVLARPIDHV